MMRKLNFVFMTVLSIPVVVLDNVIVSEMKCMMRLIITNDGKCVGVY
jgi:hypothetical protein